MNIIIDIGGTNIRIRTSDNSYFFKNKHNANSYTDLINIIEFHLKKIDNIINKIVIALPCVIHNYISYNTTNLKFLNNIILQSTILKYNTVYFNDGDLSLLGEIEYNKINKNNNILSLIFGTGVGCGIWINNNIIRNVEANKIFEDYLGGANINKENMKNKKITDNLRKKFINDLSNIIELLNIDILIINGFIKFYDQFILHNNDLLIDSYYKNKLSIIYSNCNEPVLLGGKIIKI